MKLTTETRDRIIDLIRLTGTYPDDDHRRFTAALQALDLVSKLDTEDAPKTVLDVGDRILMRVPEDDNRIFLIRFPKDVFGVEGQIEFNYTVRKGWHE